MKQGRSKNRSLMIYLYIPIILGIIMAVAALHLVLENRTRGLIAEGVVLVYLVAAVLLFVKSRRSLRETISNLTSRIVYAQKRFHEEMAVPYAIMTAAGKVIWMNEEFRVIAGSKLKTGEVIRELFPKLTTDIFPHEEGAELEIELNLDNLEYTATLARIDSQAADDTVDLLEEEMAGGLLAIYLRDDTELNEALRLLDEEELVVGLIYIDNFEEVMETVDELQQSLVAALIDREITQYIQSAKGIAKKLENDRYFVVFKQRYLEIMQEDHFSILKNIRSLNIKNGSAPTASIGLGLGGATYMESYRFARMAIELALGRGGDQVVIKNGDEMTYFGGKKELATTSSHVKARAKADAFRDFLIGKQNILVMGHQMADVDSFGASMGIYRIAKTFGKKIHIVIDEVNMSLAPLIEEVRQEHKYPKGMIITSEEALKLADETDMLVVVDTSRPSYTMCPELLDRVRNIVVIDHHRKMQESITGAALSYIEPNASSASEMVAEIMQYIQENIRPWTYEANALYAGIILDTSNFSSKTGARTFEAAAYLRRCGADIAKIRKIFRDDVDAYRAKAEIVQKAEIFRECFAIGVFPESDVPSPTVIGSQAANEMLNISRVKASFVLTLYRNTIYVSARSIDEVNVQLIMERMGGGGHMSMAGAQLPYTDLQRGVEELKTTIDEMIKEGNIE